MSDLQDALNDYDRHNGDSLRSDNLQTIVEAARRVANLEMDEASRVLYEMTGLAFRAEPIVFGALGITDTE